MSNTTNKALAGVSAWISEWLRQAGWPYESVPRGADVSEWIVGTAEFAEGLRELRAMEHPVPACPQPWERSVERDIAARFPRTVSPEIRDAARRLACACIEIMLSKGQGNDDVAAAFLITAAVLPVQRAKGVTTNDFPGVAQRGGNRVLHESE